MRRTFLLFLPLAGALLVLDDQQPGRADDTDQPAGVADVKQLRAGMTQAEVKKRFGPPNHSARQILYRRYLEQWVYDGPTAMRVEFDCVRGREPQILTVHPFTPARP